MVCRNMGEFVHRVGGFVRVASVHFVSDEFVRVCERSREFVSVCGWDFVRVRESLREFVRDCESL